MGVSQLVSLSGSHTTWLTPFFFISSRTVSGLSAITGASFIDCLRRGTPGLPLLARGGKTASAVATQLVDAPSAAAGNREIQEHEAVEHGQFAAVEYGE